MLIPTFADNQPFDLTTFVFISLRNKYTLFWGKNSTPPPPLHITDDIVVVNSGL